MIIQRRVDRITIGDSMVQLVMDYATYGEIINVKHISYDKYQLTIAWKNGYKNNQQTLILFSDDLVSVYV